MIPFLRRLATLWRNRSVTPTPAVPQDDVLYSACENVIALGFSWPAYEVAELLNDHGWTSPAARAVLQRVMRRMAGDREELPVVESPSLAHGIHAAHNHFGGSIRELATDTYRFKDGRILTFRGGRWVAHENEVAAAA